MARLVLAGKPRYEPVRPLGAGGQAEVTLARDHDIDRLVAVKRLLPERVNDDAVLRFAEEIRTVGRLEHPNTEPWTQTSVDRVTGGSEIPDRAFADQRPDVRGQRPDVAVRQSVVGTHGRALEAHTQR